MYLIVQLRACGINKLGMYHRSPVDFTDGCAEMLLSFICLYDRQYTRVFGEVLCDVRVHQCAACMYSGMNRWSVTVMGRIGKPRIGTEQRVTRVLLHEQDLC